MCRLTVNMYVVYVSRMWRFICARYRLDLSNRMENIRKYLPNHLYPNVPIQHNALGKK